MGRMSEHTGLIRSYQLLITSACANASGKMKGCHVRAADRCPFVHRHSKSQVTSFMGFPVVWWARIWGRVVTKSSCSIADQLLTKYWFAHCRHIDVQTRLNTLLFQVMCDSVIIKQVKRLRYCYCCSIRQSDVCIIWRKIFQWLSARLHNLYCSCTGDTAVLH